MTRKHAWGTALYYLVTLLIAFIAMVPFVWMISTSLKTRGALMSIPIEWVPEHPTLDAYQTVFERFPFFQTILNSLFTLGKLHCADAALGLAGRLRLHQDPLPGLRAGSGALPGHDDDPHPGHDDPLFVVMNQLGLINHYASMILPSVFKPFAVFMLVQQMRTIPGDYLDAAKIDGASTFRIYRSVMLPLCVPTLATLSITTFMESWNDYLWPLLMPTDRAKMTLPIALSTLNGQYNTEYNVLMAGSLISMIPILLLYIFAQKYFKNGLMAGGIKG